MDSSGFKSFLGLVKLVISKKRKEKRKKEKRKELTGSVMHEFQTTLFVVNGELFGQTHQALLG